MTDKHYSKNDGQYAEIINKIAEYIYNDDIQSAERRKKIVFPDGNPREIDLYVTTKSGKIIVFEVRDRKGNQSVEWIDQVIGKYKDTDFDKVWICTYGRFDLTEYAKKSVLYHNIGWRNIDFGNDMLSNDPILYIDALKPVKEAGVLKINGEDYSDLILQCIDEKGKLIDFSLRDDLYNKAIRYLTDHIQEYRNQNFYCITETIDTVDLKSSFDNRVLNVEYSFPIIYNIITDFLDENFIIENNGNKDYLVKSHRSAVIISNETITINYPFLNELREEGYIISTNFILIFNRIKNWFGHIKRIKMIDIDGAWKDIRRYRYEWRWGL